MSWVEVKEKIPGLVDAWEFDLEYSGWLPPGDPEFWKWIRIEGEALPIIADQLRKYAVKDPVVGRIVATAYLMVNELISVGDGERVEQLVKGNEIYQVDAVDLTLGGPLASALLGSMDIHIHDRASIIPELRLQKKVVTEKLEALSESMRALTWWALWGDCVSYHDYSKNRLLGSERTVTEPSEAVDFMVNELGLMPPEII